MNVITITREYGAGGGEVARKLAEALGWELLDRELLHQAAEVEHVPDAELERLDEKALTMGDRFRLHPPHEKYLHGLKLAVSSAAERGNVNRRKSPVVAILPGSSSATGGGPGSRFEFGRIIQCARRRTVGHLEHFVVCRVVGQSSIITIRCTACLVIGDRAVGPKDRNPISAGEQDSRCYRRTFPPRSGSRSPAGLKSVPQRES